jgi:predicted nucleic acid-binding protein
MEKIYLDTSVFGGYFDAEFEVWTKILFDKIIAGEYKILYSRLIDIELASAPEKVREFVDTLPKSQIEFVDISEEAIKLAEQYLNENIVGKTSRADCIHIA